MKIVKHKNEPNGQTNDGQMVELKQKITVICQKNRNVIIQVQAQNYENIFYSITHSNTPQELYTV